MAQFDWFAISGYLTIIPRGRMGYGVIGHEGHVQGA